MRPSLAWSEVATTAYPPRMVVFDPLVRVAVMMPLMSLAWLEVIHLCDHDDDALDDLIDDDQLTLSKGEDSGVREV